MSRLIFRQLFEKVSCTYTYVLGCSSTREAVVIDPVLETVERDVRLLSELRLKPVLALNTHVHADHVTGTGALKTRLPGLKSVLAKAAGGKADILLEPMEKVKFGAMELEMRPTPGHTDGCATFVLHSESVAFTGDALLIRGCGRTDFQAGNPGLLYDSVHSQILSLPKHYLLYPAHDYKGQTVTSVEEESEFNPRLTKSKEEFVHIMDNLGLSYPKQIVSGAKVEKKTYADKSLPANLVCGIFDEMDEKTRLKVQSDLAAYS